MIACFWGTDREGSWRAARAEMIKRREVFPTAPFFELFGDNVPLENFQELFFARPLIGDRVIIFFDHPSVNLPATNFVIEHLIALIASDNLFIFWEDERGGELAAAIVKAGGTAKEFKVVSDSKPQQPKAESMKLFAVADALGDKDRKRAWLLYHAARRAGAPAEEIFWKLVWKVKTLLLVATAPVGGPIPLKPYPLTQARRQIKNYKAEELARLFSRLACLYHDARRGLTDFDFAVERLLLEL